MSFASSASTRFKLRRSALIVSAGLFASALALGGTVAANAAALAPTVTATPSTATANGQVTVTVDNFQPNEALRVSFDSAPLSEYADTGFTQDQADGSGHYVGIANLPRNAAVGPHTITVTGTTTAATSTTITVVPAPVGSVSPSTVAVSAYLSKGVTVTFTGFTPGDTVTFTLADGGTGGTVGSPVVAGPTGTATLKYVPTAGAHYSTAGTYWFSAFAANGSIVATPATLTVTADPAVVAPAPVAAPAAPVKQTASFTG